MREDAERDCGLWWPFVRRCVFVSCRAKAKCKIAQSHHQSYQLVAICALYSLVELIAALEELDMCFLSLQLVKIMSKAAAR